MQALADLRKRPILSVETGKQIGEVEDVLLSLSAAFVYGVTVKDASWFSGTRVLLFSDMHRIGSDAVMAKGEQYILPLDDDAKARYSIYSLLELQGKSIFSEAGVHGGMLADLTFDSDTGELKAYKVSDGTITDLLYGRLNLPLPHAQMVCDDRIIIPEATMKLLHP